MTKETHCITCIVCPVGCEIEITIEGGKIIDIRGFACPKGKDYAIQEALDPKRIIMTVIRVINGEMPVVSVKTDKPVPKKLIEKVMEETAKIEVQAPVHIGDIIIKNIAGTGANLVATKTVRRKSSM